LALWLKLPLPVGIWS